MSQYRPIPTSDAIELVSDNEMSNGHSHFMSNCDIEGALDYNEASPHSTDASLENLFSSFKTYLGDQLSARGKLLLITLLPSFAISPYTNSAVAPRKMHKTGWLDGLRGVASLMVMFHHSSVLWYRGLHRGWGSSPENYHFVQFPIIRIFYTGPAMVAIFFVISGFSLSYRALGLIRQARFAEVLDALSSSTFRRGIRLVLPAIVVTFFMMLATCAGFYGNGPGSRHPHLAETFSQNLMHWFLTVLDISDIFRPQNYPGGYNPPYDTNLWTIDVEFHGSLVIFITLLGVAKVRQNFRLLILICIPLWLLYYLHTHLFLFMSGVLLCELHYMREERLQATQSTPRSAEPRFLETTLPQLYCPRVNFAFWIINFVVSLYVLTMPLVTEGAAASPGYKTLTSWIPASYRQPFVEDQFWIHLAAVHLIWTIDNAPIFQSVFTTRFAQYLGKIGFSLYLIHGTFLYTIGYRLSGRMHAWTGVDTGFRYSGGVFLTGCVMYPLLFWASDVVYRHVDLKSVSFARWLHVRLSVPTS